MWLFTNFGFYTITQDGNNPHLTVRTHTAEDLEALRLRCPALSPAQKDTTSDYPYRAHVSRTAFAIAFASILQRLDYSDFETEVKQGLGWERARLYGKVNKLLKSLESDEGQGGKDRPRLP